jgi:hypothetical protein
MNPEVAGILAGAFFAVGLPTIWILTNHQRKMAELIHRQAPQENQQSNDNTMLIVQELRLMRSELASLTIAVDNIKDTQELSQRLAANEAKVNN